MEVLRGGKTGANRRRFAVSKEKHRDVLRSASHAEIGFTNGLADAGENVIYDSTFTQADLRSR